MSSEVAIDIRAVSKHYRLYSRPHQRLVHGVFGWRADKWYRHFQALLDVSLTVYRGETIGIVGQNGSGKSTLLQIICGILQPSSGSVAVRGRVAALLELGAGFNPEFTGRENVYLNGTVLGLSKKEIDTRFDDIVAFADIGDFINQPVKTYSSGMFIRLAFAVAISIEPAILVVDEALSVGDEAFQRKCFARIEELKRHGCTILFVSHSAGSVVQLCDRAVLLDGGELLYSGEPKATVARYQRLLYASADKRQSIREEIRSALCSPVADATDPVAAEVGAKVRFASNEGAERYDPGLVPESTVSYQSHGASIMDAHLVNDSGERVNVLVPGRNYRYRYRVDFSRDASRVHFGMMIKSLAGIELFGMSSHAHSDAIETVRAGMSFHVEFRFQSAFLPGVYFTNAGVVGSNEQAESGFLHRVLDAAMFKVEATRTDRMMSGFYDLALEPACRCDPIDQER